MSADDAQLRAYVSGWNAGATGKPAKSTRLYPVAYERGYNAGRSARRGAVRNAAQMFGAAVPPEVTP